MAKITRYGGDLKAFGSTATGTERTVFGDVTQADDLDSNINVDWLRGWGTVGVNENPTKQDFNAVAYTMGELLSYLHQAGVAEWNVSQEYFIGSITTTAAGAYRSLSASNIGNDPDSDEVNWDKIITRDDLAATDSTVLVGGVEARLVSTKFPTVAAMTSVTEMDLAYHAANKSLIETSVNHDNSSPGGGATYRVMTATEYGGVPDSVIIGGVITGADHYIGGGTTYVARLEPRNGEFWAEMFGISVDSTQSNSTIIFNNAFSYLSGRTMHLAEKRFRYSGVVTAMNISIKGIRMPRKSPNNDSLVNGSVLVGTLYIQSASVNVESFGVDHGLLEFPVIAGDAFKCRPLGGSGSWIRAVSISGMGRDYADEYHAILIEDYERCYIDKIYGYRNVHGVALKCRNGFVGDIIGEDNRLDNIIIKSDAATNSTRNLSISRLVGIGTAGLTNVNVEIEAVGEQLQNINIGEIVGSNAKNHIQIISDDLGSAIVNNLNIGMIVGSGSEDVAIRTLGSLVAVTIGQFNVQTVQGKAADFDKVNHLVINSFVASAGPGNADYAVDFFTVGADCGAVQIDQISLLDEFNLSGAGVATFNNGRGRNKIGQYNCNLAGVGAPITQVLTVGPTELASPIKTYKTARINVVSNAAATDLQLNADDVEDGHIIVVDNSSGVTFDIVDESAPTTVLLTIFNGSEGTFICANGVFILMARR